LKCRICAAPLGDVFLDLGSAPPSNAFLSPEALSAPEIYYPLKLYTCANCFLVQVDEVQPHTQLFASDYAYFSSFSRSWLAHAERFVDEAALKLGLGRASLVMEIASNDGYLLQYVAARGIPCVGIEPTAGTARSAREKGIETLERFFGRAFASEFVRDRRKADLIVANNVLAHVPDLHDFLAGVALALADEGVATFEFPHLLRLIEQGQFDTVYHEHFSYFSFATAMRALATHGLRVWDVQELSTHGGSLRVWVCRDVAAYLSSDSVCALLAAERAAGMEDIAYYCGFQARANAIKNEFLAFLLE